MCYQGPGALWGSPRGLEWGQKGGWRLCNDITSHRPSSSLAHHHQGTKSSQTQQSLKTLETFNFLLQKKCLMTSLEDPLFTWIWIK